ILNLENQQIETNTKFDQIFSLMHQNKLKSDQGIFFDGQVYDAYVFISDLIRSANKSIYIIDNYLDDTVLTILLKRKENIDVVIFTSSISKQFALDLHKHNSQYESIQVKTLKNVHDRFLIIDNEEIYHIGASLKDLGKKWFAF
ncbi:MAG: ORF6N domain-containing protein, partial [Fluviicola sp.]|nr:ORF6N domain-containing protein [Fluviicola sp.]